MDHCILHETPDGKALITHLAPDWIAMRRAENPEMTDEALLQEAAAQINLVSHEIMRKVDLPDPYFREAWVKQGKNCVVDMPKARAVHMDKIRIVRDEKLKALDIETLKGIDVQAQKTVLRDIPQTFNLSTLTTPEDLKAAWPEVLK